MCCVVQMRAQVHEGDDMTHVIGVMHYILAHQYCSSVDASAPFVARLAIIA